MKGRGHIENYLDELRAALGDLDRSTVHDALANAEDHLMEALRSEQELNPDADPAELARKVIGLYGSPEDIRGVYSDIE